MIGSFKEREYVEKLRERAILKDLAFVLESPEGRRVIARLLKLGMRDEVTLNVDGVNGHIITAFNEGKRAIASMLTTSVKEVDPRKLMLCEIELSEFERGFSEEDEE